MTCIETLRHLRVPAKCKLPLIQKALVSNFVRIRVKLKHFAKFSDMTEALAGKLILLNPAGNSIVPT